ncbi:MAG: AAA family ATPase, partial [Gemmatimonadales bacterium]
MSRHRSMAMELPDLIESLSRPGAYPHPFEDFQLHHTHISVVFLVDRYAYKIKKPVDLDFLDFTTLDKRKHYCEEEVRLNRRLASSVYLGVVPVTAENGGLRMGGDGEAVEYAVKMRRLPPQATFLARLERGALESAHVEQLARRLATFHGAIPPDPAASRYCRFDVVAGNARENLEQSRPHIGETISRPVFERLTELLETRLSELRPLIEARAAEDVPRDTHGDLHLDHVYLFPERKPPADLLVIDCIEFNERFLMPFYIAYRAAVRAKVEGMITEEGEVPEADRQAAIQRSRAYWLLALAQLEDPIHRPCLLLMGGLPGTGKTTIADAVAERGGFRVLSADRTRKELAGLDPRASAAADFGQGIYTAEWNRRTYSELLRRADQGLFRGERVLVDASFGRQANREE